MKAIVIFSGKGGVGKSTIAALLAIAISQKHKTVLLDADINTPSIPILFGNKQTVKNLSLISYGYEVNAKTPISLTGSIAKQALRNLVNKVNKISPEVCIIDMPPGTGDIQMELCSNLKPSAALLVSQSNKLSKQDANRAMQLFMIYGIPIIGIIENMAGNIFGKSHSAKLLGLPILASIKLKKQISILANEGRIYNVENPFRNKYQKILKQAQNISWETIKKTLLEGPTDTSDIIEKRKIPLELCFYGTNTWDNIRHLIFKKSPFNDLFLTYCTAEKIRQMLDGLDEDGNGIFMIIKAPQTSIPLFPGEIGHATFSIDDKKYYYGVPRVKYQTDKGEVTLFPYEVGPTTTESLLSFQNDKELIRMPGSTIARYIPTHKMMKEIEYTYGRLTSIPHNWKKLYKEMGITK